MPNWFYIDAFGQQQGPVSDAQLKELAMQGIIEPDTPLQTDTGHKGKAGQIKGLCPPAPFVQPAEASPLFDDAEMAAMQAMQTERVAYQPQQAQPQRSGRTRYAGTADNSTMLLIFSILMTFCCFTPAGIVAIIFSVLCKNDFAAGRYDSAARNSKIAFWSLIAGLIIYVIIVVFYCVLILPAAIKAAQEAAQQAQEQQRQQNVVQHPVVSGPPTQLTEEERREHQQRIREQQQRMAEQHQRMLEQQRQRPLNQLRQDMQQGTPSGRSGSGTPGQSGMTPGRQGNGTPGQQGTPVAAPPGNTQVLPPAAAPPFRSSLRNITEAAEKGTRQDIEFFARQSPAPFDLLDDKRNTLLHIAARGNPNVETLEFLVTQKADVNARNMSGNTPLHLAALSNPNAAAVEYLTGQGADVNAKNENGRTPWDVANTPEKKAILSREGGKSGL